VCLVSWPLTVTVINTGVRPTNLVGLELRTKDGVAFSVGPRSSHGVIPYWGPELPQLLGDGEQVMLELDLVQAYKAVRRLSFDVAFTNVAAYDNSGQTASSSVPQLSEFAKVTSERVPILLTRSLISHDIESAGTTKRGHEAQVRDGRRGPRLASRSRPPADSAGADSTVRPARRDRLKLGLPGLAPLVLVVEDDGPPLIVSAGWGAAQLARGRRTAALALEHANRGGIPDVGGRRGRWSAADHQRRTRTSTIRGPLTSRVTRTAECGPCGSADVSRRSSSSAVRPTVTESSETFGRRTLDTGECSSGSASLMP
jgi:hypothetical protein